MKARNILAGLLLMMAGVQAALAQKMVVTTMDNQVVKFDVSNVKDVTFEEEEPPVIIDVHEYVDLGLPSGTLWATCNVGASSPEEYGDYFAWGETEGYNSGKTTFIPSTYKWCNGTYNTITKYCNDSSDGYNGFTDTLTELLPEDDAATANWGAGWQMPSYDQIQELLSNTKTWTMQNGVNGYKITSKSNGNSIFLPAAGRYSYSLDDVGSHGYYWSRSLGTGGSYGADNLEFVSDYISNGHHSGRFYGFSVRPVRKQ